MRAKPAGSKRSSGHTPPGRLPSDASLAGLSWLNFLVSMMQTGFGTFIAVNLTSAQWSRTDVGLALSVTSVAGIVAQVPGGAMVDATSRKRLAAGIAILIVAGAAGIIAFWQAPPVVFAALALQGSASAVLSPAIAALTLALVPQAKLAERLGLNGRYASLGAAIAAGAMGLASAMVSSRLSLILAAGFGLAALVALRCIAARDLANAPVITDHVAVSRPGANVQWESWRSIAGNRDLMVFGVCMLLFQLGNAGVLPLAVGSIVRQDGQGGGLLVAAAVIVSQLLAAILASPMGRMAEQWGRRPVLLFGLLALPVKAGLFAFGGPSALVVVYQAFDAVSAASLGLIVPLMVADITRRRGHFNLALGLVGVASGLGGTGGAVLAGAIADWLGVTSAFVALAAIGLAAGVLARMMLAGPVPITRPS